MRMAIIASAFECLQTGNVMDQKGPGATKLAVAEPSSEGAPPKGSIFVAPIHAQKRTCRKL